MKQFFLYLKQMPLKKKIKYCTMLGSFLVILGLVCIGNSIKNSLPDVNAYKTWDDKGGYTQISAYLPVGQMQDKTMYDGMMFQMNESLEKESIKPENKDSRILLGAYSGYGNVTMKTRDASATVNAIGIGGDFFYFHPIELIDGSYLNDDYLMKDYVVLDRETAWKLFGAVNVTGMQVMIGDTPFIVAGVYDKTDAWLSKEAGLSESTVFLFYDSLSKYGSVSGIQWLDFIIPNPVKGYGKKVFKENSTINLDNAVVIEQSRRFDILPLYKMMPDYLERVMSKSGIIYPYWENMARGYENILVAFLLVETVCLLCGVLLLLNIVKPVKSIKKGINWIVTKIKGRNHYENKSFKKKFGASVSCMHDFFSNRLRKKGQGKRKTEDVGE